MMELDKERAYQKESIADLEKQMPELDKERASQKEKITDLEKQIQELDNERASQKETIADLEKQMQAERYKRAVQHTENIFADSAALSGGRGEGMVRQSQTSPERAPAVAGAAQTGRGSRVGSRTERPRATAAGALQCPRRQPAWHAHTAGGELVGCESFECNSQDMSPAV
ncbi:uncharacterized protein LOC144133748 [Amblyomma americanum]